MTIPLDTIINPFGLFENYYLNFYNISLTDESLTNFLQDVEKMHFLKSMITTIGIKKTQEISQPHTEMLKKIFLNWNGVFQIHN
jgi:hypothetical protein